MKSIYFNCKSKFERSMKMSQNKSNRITEKSKESPSSVNLNIENI